MSTYVAVFALVLAYVAVVAAYVALRTLAKVRREVALARGGARPAQAPQVVQQVQQVQVPKALVEATHRNTESAGVLATQLEQLRMQLDDTTAVAAAAAEATAALAERQADTALRNIALVRYDAFGEMSGRMSFSVALLNDNGDGVTISAIAGRSDTSIYAKGVTNGQGEHELSPEEQQAVSTAMHRPRQGLLGRKAS